MPIIPPRIQFRRMDLQKTNIVRTFAAGEMAEWSIAAVLKTVELRGSGGSNPSLSAGPAGQYRTANRQGPRILKIRGPCLISLRLP